MKPLKYLFAVLGICLLSKVIATAWIEYQMANSDFNDGLVQSAYFGMQLFLPLLVALCIVYVIYMVRPATRFRQATMLWLGSALTSFMSTWVMYVLG